jgi:DNA-binding phage protein
LADREKEAFVRRLEAAAKRVGSLYALAKKAGLSDETLYAIKNRGTEPSRINLIKLALAAGVSVEWLATGKDPVGWDASRLRDVVETIEEWLESKRRTLTPNEKAELVAEVYEEIAHQERPQVKEPAEPRESRIIRLVEKLAA